MESAITAYRHSASKAGSRRRRSQVPQGRKQQRGVDQATVEEALRQSLELLEVVRRYQRHVQASVSPMKRNSSTQTTEDKATQASPTATSSASSEIQALKESIRAISRRIRDINSSRTYSSRETPFKTPEKSSDRDSCRPSFAESPEFIRKPKSDCY